MGFRVQTGNRPVENANAENQGSHWLVHMNNAKMEKLAAMQGVKVAPATRYDLSRVEDRKRYISEQEQMIAYGMLGEKNAYFPRKPRRFQWDNDNFGPLWVPKAGETVTLSDSLYPLYRKCIEVYEKNEVKRTGRDQFVINGEATNQYTFKMDYYFMMGDNRHQSLDSRYWGFVPEDHVVGRPMMILFSWENGPRWDRFFNFVSKFEP